MYQPSIHSYSQDDDIQEIAVITPFSIQEIRDQAKQNIESPRKNGETIFSDTTDVQIVKAPVFVSCSIDEIHEKVKARIQDKPQNENNNISNCNPAKKRKLSLNSKHNYHLNSLSSEKKVKDAASCFGKESRRSSSPEIVILEEVTKKTQEKSEQTTKIPKTINHDETKEPKTPLVSPALITKAIQITNSLILNPITANTTSDSSAKKPTTCRKSPLSLPQLKAVASTSSASLSMPSTSGLPPSTPPRLLEKTPQKQEPSTPLGTPMSTNSKRSVKRLLQEDNGIEKSLIASPSKIDLETEAEMLPKHENLRIFKLILTGVWACKKSMHLFDSPDLHCFGIFQELSEEAKILYVQLLKMKHQWRRVSTIKYDDIRPDLLPVIKELVVQNFLEDSEELVDLRTMLDLLKIPELKSVMNTFHVQIIGRTKSAMIDALISCGRTQRSIFPTANGSPVKRNVTSAISERTKNILGPCVRLQAESAETLQRVYLLGSLPSCFSDENLSTFIFRIYKSLRQFTIYPEVQIERSQVIFRDKASLLKFQKSYNMYMDAIKLTQSKGWDEIIRLAQDAWAMFKELHNNINLREHDMNLPTYLRCFTAGEVLVGVLKIGLDAMGRRKQYAVIVELLRDLLAQEIYKTRHRGFWYERLALTLHVHIKDPDKAAEAVIEAMSDTHVHLISKLALRARASQLLNRKTWKPSPNVRCALVQFLAALVQEPTSKTITARSRVGQGQGLKLDYIQEGTGEDEVVVSSVEELAISYYKRTEGFAEGVHAEGTLIASLFGILFWDVIYEHFVPDAFLSKYQEFPLDLKSRDFYHHREAAIESRLAEIELWTDLQAQIFLQGIWEQHVGKLSVVSWKIFRDMQQAQDLLVCIGMKPMAGICRRLCEEYQIARSGFPDIALWKPGEQKMCKFVEVKGPSDNLSNKQRVWIDYLMKFGINVEVCYVKIVSEKYLGATS